MGLETETAENVVLIIPKATAQRLIDARDEPIRIAALQDGAAYLNSRPISIFPCERKELAVVPATLRVASVIPRPISSRAKLEETYHDAFTRMVKELDSQAHFVAYAPPSFIAFREGQYLELPMATPLAAADAGSQYKLAALAFDRHVAHLIRPVLAYFKDASDFTGFDFSTTVRLAGSAEGEASESVEFIFPWSALRSYAQYNLTGQQLLDAGVVLINGERVGLDLQTAEARGSLHN